MTLRPAEAGEIPFVNGVSVGNAPVGMRGLVAGDFDRNGRLDFAAVCGGDGTLRWWRRTSGGAWTVQVAQRTLAGVSALKLADLDQDGDLDAVATGGSATVWWENANSTGTSWNLRPIASDAAAFSDFALADINHDAKPDLYGLNHAAQLVWLKNGDRGTSWTVSTVIAAPGVSAAAAADLDRDGQCDVAGVSATAGTVTWWENTLGRGAAWTEHAVASGFGGASSVMTADFDRDGDVDLACASASGNRVAWWENTNRTGTVWTQHDIDTTATGAALGELYDFDGDGDQDLLGLAGGQGAWWENRMREGAGWVRRDLAQTAGAVAVAAGDVDRDGDPDLACVGADADTLKFVENRAIHSQVMFDYGKVICPQYNFADPEMVSADMDGDGDLDLLPGTYYNNNYYSMSSPRWLENTGTGAEPWKYHSLDSSDMPFRMSKAADVDGDGDNDIVTCQNYLTTTRLAWWENKTGAATTWTRHDVIGTSSSSPSGLVLADFDRDGDTDVAFQNYAGMTAWIENASGDGATWAWHKINDDTYNNYYHLSLSCRDMDRDGDLDLVCSSYYGLLWWENRLSSGQDWALHGKDEHIYDGLLLDVDADGDTDIFGWATWWENADGKAGVWKTHDVPANPLASKVRFGLDLDGDSDQDLLGILPAPDYRVIWWENLDGFAMNWARYLTAQPMEPKVYGLYMNVFDANQDDQPDLLCGNSESDFILKKSIRRQYDWAVTDLAPDTYSNGQIFPVLNIRLSHLGHPGDLSLAIASLGLRLEEKPGDGLISAEAGVLFKDLRIYRDNQTGSQPGVFDNGDQLVTQLDTLTLATSGSLSIPLGKENTLAQLAPGQSADYFVVVRMNDNVQGKDPRQFRIVHQNQGDSVIKDVVYNVPLNTCSKADVATRMVYASRNGWQWKTSIDTLNSSQISGHSVVWTGDKALIWGGRLGGWNVASNNKLTSQGLIFNPATGSFSPMSQAGAPTTRFLHSAVWTGSRMIVWGGLGRNGYLEDGASYDPATDTWETLAINNLLTYRSQAVAVWTGSKMLVWGGYCHYPNAYSWSYFNDGASYDPVAKVWKKMAASPLTGRVQCAAVWTGSRLIIWGGSRIHGNAEYFDDGAAYDPQTDTWTPISSAHGLAPRDNCTATWTGSRMLILGGSDGVNYFQDGAAYDPVQDKWSPLDLSGLPGRACASGACTGPDLFYWGGLQSNAMLNDGLLADPLVSRVQPLGQDPAPNPRSGQQSAWMGPDRGMLIYGGVETDYNAPRSYAVLAYHEGPQVPTASFSRKRLTEPGPCTIQFTDTSAGQPASWAWDFTNDGTIDSTERDPIFTYATPGNYSVRLRVSNELGSNEIVRAALITPQDFHPESDFSASPTMGMVPLTVRFTDQSRFGADHWAWDFTNDGTIDSTGQNPTFTYAQPGTYTVRLVASNPFGSGTLVRQQAIQVLPALQANFNVSTTAGTLPLTVYFEDLSVNGPTSWAWDFNNDGTTDSTSRNPWYTYKQAGSHTVKLTVKNAYGQSIKSKPNLVRIDFPPTGRSDLPSVIDLDNPVENTLAPGLRVFAGDQNRQLGNGKNSLAMGDLNGDGLEDLVAMGSYAHGPDSQPADLEIVYGRSDLITTQTISLADPPAAGLQTRLTYGTFPQHPVKPAVACGDVDGDGVDDLVLGSIRIKEGTAGASTENVYVVYGRRNLQESARLDITGEPERNRITRIAGGVPGEGFGSALSIGDMNGDGYGDIVIGSPGASELLSVPPNVYIVYGGANLPGRTINLQTTDGAISAAGETRIVCTSNNGVGLRHVACGDINGDGLDDTIMNYDLSSGEVYVVFGSATLPRRKIELSPCSGGIPSGVMRIGYSPGWGVNNFFGMALASGDVNQDGFDDIVACYDNNTPGNGAAYVIFGRPERPGQIIDVTQPASSWGGIRLDWSASYRWTTHAACADINGDGIDDILLGDEYWYTVGNHGHLCAYYGGAWLNNTSVDWSKRQPDVTVLGRGEFDEWSSSIVAGGDFNGDGWGDFAASADSSNMWSGSYVMALMGNGRAASASATEYFGAGRSTRRGFGGLRSRTLRAWVRYGDGLAAPTQARLLRRAPNVDGVSANYLAGVQWGFTSDRVISTSATLTLKYLDSEIAGLAESDLRVIQYKDGQYYKLPTVLDLACNHATVEVDSLTTFGLVHKDFLPWLPAKPLPGVVGIRSIPPTGWVLTDNTGRSWLGSGDRELTGVPAGPLSLRWTAPAGYEAPQANPAAATLADRGRVDFFEIFIPASVGWERNGSRVLRYLLGVEGNPAGLDFNEDGDVTIGDYIYSQRKIPPSLPVNPSPANSASGVAIVPTLTWKINGTRNTACGLYLWPASQARPANPVVSGLNSNSYKPGKPLAFNTTYNWQVVSWYGELPIDGPVWKLKTAANPVQVVSPNGGQVLKRGGSAQVHWKLNKTVAGTQVRLELWRNGARAAALGSFSATTGEATSTVKLPASLAAAKGYRVRAISTKLEKAGAPVPWDESDGTIEITK